MNRFKLKRVILQLFLLIKRARILKLQRCCIGTSLLNVIRKWNLRRNSNLVVPINVCRSGSIQSSKGWMLNWKRNVVKIILFCNSNLNSEWNLNQWWINSKGKIAKSKLNSLKRNYQQMNSRNHISLSIHFAWIHSRHWLNRYHSHRLYLKVLWHLLKWLS